MRHPFLELPDYLKIKQPKMTTEEEEIIRDCEIRAVRDFFVVGSIAAAVVWIGTRKLKNNFLSVCLAGGTRKLIYNFFSVYDAGGGIIAGTWRVNESLDSSVNDILGMEGSRMQHELRKIVVEKYGSNPQRMKTFAKHFYTEEVFNDSAHGNPKTIYRHRNSYAEDQLIANTNTYGVPNANKSMTGMGIRPVRINPIMNMVGYGDPMEVLFGYSLVNDESPQPNESATSPKSQTRSQRRAHRRHRMRHRHRDLSLEDA